MAWITPPAVSPWVDLAHTAPGAILTTALTAAAVLAFGPALAAVQRLSNRAARRMRQVSTDVDRWIAEDAPRPAATRKDH